MGALYVSVSDGDAGTENEVPIYASHSPGSDRAQMISSEQASGPTTSAPLWDEMLGEPRLWSNATLEVGCSLTTDVEALILSTAAAADLPSTPRFRLEALAARDWVPQ